MIRCRAALFVLMLSGCAHWFPPDKPKAAAKPAEPPSEPVPSPAIELEASAARTRDAMLAMLRSMEEPLAVADERFGQLATKLTELQKARPLPIEVAWQIDTCLEAQSAAKRRYGRCSEDLQYAALYGASQLWKASCAEARTAVDTYVATVDSLTAHYGRAIAGPATQSQKTEAK